MLLSAGIDLSCLSHAPVPVDDILERRLGLSLDFDDLRGLGSRGAMGALNVRKKAVFIDEKLDPCVYPRNRERFNFTVAHEMGHWLLHQESEADGGGVATQVESALHVCTDREDAQLEWEANYFAACLLMPRLMVEAAWVLKGGRLGQAIIFDPVIHAKYIRRPRRGLVHIGTIVDQILEPRDRYLFEVAASTLAPTFDVSIEAMRIRLETLGMLKGENFDPEKQLNRFFAKIFDIPTLHVFPD